MEQWTSHESLFKRIKRIRIQKNLTKSLSYDQRGQDIMTSRHKGFVSAADPQSTDHSKPTRLHHTKLLCNHQVKSCD